MVTDVPTTTAPGRRPEAAPATERQIRDVTRTGCCIVGGGPAGTILGLLLARRGIPVTLLEEHADFDRDFRGDAIQPAMMELMDELGLSDGLVRLPHTRIDRLTVTAGGEPVTIADYARLKGRYPYLLLMQQVLFLDFVVAEAKRLPSFQIVMSAAVQELIEEAGPSPGGGPVVRGVRYRSRDGWHEVRAPLTIGADGRYSRLRRLSGFETVKTAEPTDVIWFKLPRRPGEPEGAFARMGRGRIVLIINRNEEWQIGYVIPKGAYQEIRGAGFGRVREDVAALAPELADRVENLQDWKQVAVLPIESSRVPRWYRPGLLLIGDAAHVMSPVGAVGILYAVQDAVVAANVLSEPLLAGRLRLRDLAAVQRQREWPTRFIQTLQAFLQERVFTGAMDPDKPPTPPAFFRLPIIRDIPARLLAFGVWPVHVKP
jgi:2-polyprenyl-6-methoxyphenol hydroxylase-like FAD-dependent oxidoreductase